MFTSIGRPKSVKILTEETEDLELELARNEVECRGMLGEAKAEGRDLTAAEDHRFNISVKRAKETKAKLAQLKSELTKAQELEKRFTMAHPSGTVYGQSSYVGDEQVAWRTAYNPADGATVGRPRYGNILPVARLKSFRNSQEAYDSGQWLKAVLHREIYHRSDEQVEDYCNSVGLDITNAAYEGSGTAGGYLLPSPMAAAIIEVRERVGVARQVCNVMPTSGDTLTVPKRTNGLAVYIVGEGQTITDSDKAWGSVGLTLKKRACLSYLSQELSQDAIINMIDNLAAEQAYSLGGQEDSELVLGDASSSYGGINGLLSSIGSAGVSTAAVSSTWAALTLAEVVAAVGLLPDRYHVYGPSWICSHSFFNQVMVRLAFAAGGATMSEVMGGAANMRTFLGYPVHLTSKMPTATAVSTKCALFGAFNQAVILADRGGIRLQRSDDIKFVEDQIALKAVSRYDMNVHDPGDSSNAGAYVALSTHS